MNHLTSPRRRALRWAALAAWMLVIFLLSAQASEESSALSGVVMQVVVAVLDWVARLLGADGLPAEVLGVLHTVVRKSAHVLAYAVLGALALWALVPRLGETADGAGGGAVGGRGATAGETADGAGGGVVARRHVAGALLVSVTYAATDEFHQTLVPGRGGAITDVLLDAAGALAGILLLRWWWGRKA